MPDDLKTDDVLSNAELVVARVCVLNEIADTATRYMQAMDGGDDAGAASELAQLRGLCEERARWVASMRAGE